MIEIDGSHGEGGGQMVRSSLTLAVLTGQPVHLQRIRAGRKNPGLAAQHLAAVVALARICRANVHGASVGATELWFEPRERPQAGEYLVDVAEIAQAGSAGAVSLVFQAMLLPLAFAGAPSQLTLRGGTHVAWSPPFDYLAQVYLPTVARMGLHAQVQLAAWGFYPAGQGEIAGQIEPVQQLRALDLVERGALVRIQGASLACNLPADIAQRIGNRAANVLQAARLRASITPQRVRGAGPGAVITLAAGYDNGVAGFSALGERGKPSEQVADQAANDLLAFHHNGAPVDAHLADQVLLPMALAHGTSTYRTSKLTLHTLTNADIISRFVPAGISIEGAEGEPATITVQGVSFRNVEC